MGKPTLLQDEDGKDYRKLLRMVSELLKPEDLFDELEVREIANNIWEAQRYQKLGTELVDAERVNAIRKLADSKHGYVSKAAAKNVSANTEIPRDGIGEHILLKKLRIKSELVRATSVLLAAGNFSVLDRLISNRIATRKAALKDYERRKLLAAKVKRSAAKAKRRLLGNDNESKEVKVQKPKKFASDENRNDWA